MKIVVAARCYNEERNIERFLKAYDFADIILISYGGSILKTDEMLNGRDKVRLVFFQETETLNGETWNPDNPHIEFLLDEAKKLDPTWLIFDDLDDVPNFHLHKDARVLLENCTKPQVNAYRLYLWGDTGQFFPEMNNNFTPEYKSLWAWRPDRLNIHADLSVRHGTLLGVTDDYYGLDIPYCLLHKSWHPDTIEKKIARYNALGLPMSPLSEFAGEAKLLPEWGYE